MSVQRVKSLSTKGKVSITMPHHINKVTKEVSGKLRNLSHSSPNSPKLSGVRKDDKDIDPKNTKVFHRPVAQLL